MKTRRIVSLTILGAFIIAGGLLSWRMGREIVALVTDAERFRAWIDAKGVWARVCFMGMVAAQVVLAVIPGEPLELAAGYAFGAVEGTMLCVGGITLGSLIVFGLVRVFGMRMVRLFFDEEKIRRLPILNDPKKLFLLTAVLMVVPGTPKDMLTYAAGLTPISPLQWLLLCSVGRIPSVVTSTICGGAVSDGSYITAGVVLAVTGAICLFGLWLFAKLSGRTKV